MKRLSRRELLEMLIYQIEENERIKQKLEIAEKNLRSREIEMKGCGSIAEAAIELNRVFEAADSAAEQYVENMKSYCEKQCQITKNVEMKSREKCVELIRNTEEKCAEMEKECRERCNLMQDTQDK